MVILFYCRSVPFVTLWRPGCSFPVNSSLLWKCCCLQHFPEQTEAARPRGMGDLLLPSFQLVLGLYKVLVVEVCFSMQCQTCGVYKKCEWPMQTRGRVMHQSGKGNTQSAFILQMFSPLICPVGVSHRHSRDSFQLC